MNVKGWPEVLDKAVKEKFGLDVKTEWNIFSMCYITHSGDGELLPNKAYDYIEAFMKAVDAMQNGEIKYDK